MQPWEAAATAWLAPGCAAAVIDGVGIDHYPGTWTIDPSFTAWAPLDRLLTLVNDGRWDKTPPGPKIPEEILSNTLSRYQEAARRLFG